MRKWNRQPGGLQTFARYLDLDPVNPVTVSSHYSRAHERDSSQLLRDFRLVRFDQIAALRGCKMLHPRI